MIRYTLFVTSSAHEFTVVSEMPRVGDRVTIPLHTTPFVVVEVRHDLEWQGDQMTGHRPVVRVAPC